MANKETERERVSVFPFVSMGVFLLATQVLALILAKPFEVSDIRAFENPSSVWNPIYFIVLVLVITAVILLLVKLGGAKLVHIGMLGAIAATLYYVMQVLIPPGFVIFGFYALPLIAAISLTILLYAYPEWYVVDAVGLLLGAGVASIFGISLDVPLVIMLLLILAVYDAVSVYRTKHMVSLAESVIEMRIPILFVVPKSRNFSLRRKNISTPSTSSENSGAQSERSAAEDLKRGQKRLSEEGGSKGDAFFMGLGDAIIPAILAVSACFPERYATFSAFGLNITPHTTIAPAIGAVVGTLAGYAVLCTFVGRGKPHAGLPLLNSGAIVGFLIGLLFA